MENYENNQIEKNVEPNYNNGPYTEQPVSMGEWLGSLCLLLIPCVNLVLVCVWAFGNGKESKKNFFRAYLIYMAIAYVLAIVLYVVLFAIIGISSSMYY